MSPQRGKGSVKPKFSGRINNGLTLTQMVDPTDSDDEETEKNKKPVHSNLLFLIYLSINWYRDIIICMKFIFKYIKVLLLN